MGKKYRVTLTVAEREYLQDQLKKDLLRGQRLRRAQILLASDESPGGKKLKDDQIRLAYGCTCATVENTRRRFVENGFDLALNGKPRPVNRRSKLDGRAESKLLALRCSHAPDGHRRWTLRLLADRMVELGYVESISHQGVNDVLKKHKSSLGVSSPG